MSHKTHHTYNTVRMFSLWFLPGYSPTVQRHAVSRVRLIDDSKLVQRCECECEWSVSVVALRQTLYLFFFFLVTIHLVAGWLDSRRKIHYLRTFSDVTGKHE